MVSTVLNNGKVEFSIPAADLGKKAELALSNKYDMEYNEETDMYDFYLVNDTNKINIFGSFTDFLASCKNPNVDANKDKLSLDRLAKRQEGLMDIIFDLKAEISSLRKQLQQPEESVKTSPVVEQPTNSQMFGQFKAEEKDDIKNNIDITKAKPAKTNKSNK